MASVLVSIKRIKTNKDKLYKFIISESSINTTDILRQKLNFWFSGVGSPASPYRTRSGVEC